LSDKLQRLRAEDVEDLAVIAALLQDARITVRDMAYDHAERTFMAAFTRYRHEAAGSVPSEVTAALIFGCIEGVQHRGVETSDLERQLTLLTVATEPGDSKLFHIDLLFDGGAQIRLKSDCIHCRLEDFGKIVPASTPPLRHFDDDDAVAGGAGVEPAN